MMADLTFIAPITEGANAGMLKKMPLSRDHGPHWDQTFSLSEFVDDPGRWQLAFLRWGRTAGSGQDGTDRLQERIRVTFQNGFFENLTPAAMLKPSCMICGKGLTDPASMARWIGPECAATSSVRIPQPTLKKGSHHD